MMKTFVTTMVVMTLAAAPAGAQELGALRALSAIDAARVGRDASVEAQAASKADQKDRELEARDRERDQRDREVERVQRERERESSLFEQATAMVDSGKWDRAVEAYARLAELKGTRAAAALYWKAYSQDRAGQRAEALATIAELTKTYSTSPYVKQAQALEVEVRRNVGQPVRPEAMQDEELKLMALNAILNSDPDKAIPILEKLLQGPSSPRLRERAVFVLAQSTAPRARQVLKDLARGSATPELQTKAIQYLGVSGGAESRTALAEVYAASSDVDVKRRILRAFMTSGDKARVLTAAQTEQNAELRGEAVRQLGAMGANEELWQLYQKESSVDIKKQIIQGLFVGRNTTRMIELAKAEKVPELRAMAVRNLGMMDGAKTGDTLLDIYNSEKDAAIRRSIVNALSQQGNATALVTLARKESDIEVKKAIVQRLATMRDKVATDYMLELLNK